MPSMNTDIFVQLISLHHSIMKRVIHSLRVLFLFFSFVLFIGHTLAEPPEAVWKEFLAHRKRHREARFSSQVFLSRAGSSVAKLDSFQAGQDSNSSNWAGAVQTSPPSGTFNFVSGQWIIPGVSRPPSANNSGKWSSAEWIGIDGWSCGTAILQAGTYSYFQDDGNGNMTAGSIAWYEWFPNPLQEFSGFSVAIGDTVEFSVTAYNLSRGIAIVNNLSTGNSTSIVLSAPNNSSLLCGSNAEWILEDISVNGGLAPFSRFTEASFLNCTATTTNGALVNLTNATLVNMVQNSTILATPRVVNSTELQVSYG